VPRVVQPYYSIRYDGTNGRHIAGVWCTGITFVSDSGDLLTYTDNQDNRRHTVSVGDWLIAWGPAATDPWAVGPAEYASRYYELPE